jgi:hypothetical protein
VAGLVMVEEGGMAEGVREMAVGGEEEKSLLRRHSKERRSGA